MKDDELARDRRQMVPLGERHREAPFSPVADPLDEREPFIERVQELFDRDIMTSLIGILIVPALQHIGII